MATLQDCSASHDARIETEFRTAWIARAQMQECDEDSYDQVATKITRYVDQVANIALTDRVLAAREFRTGLRVMYDQFDDYYCHKLVSFNILGKLYINQLIPEFLQTEYDYQLLATAMMLNVFAAGSADSPAAKIQAGILQLLSGVEVDMKKAHSDNDRLALVTDLFYGQAWTTLFRDETISTPEIVQRFIIDQDFPPLAERLRLTHPQNGPLYEDMSLPESF